VKKIISGAKVCQVTLRRKLFTGLQTSKFIPFKRKYLSLESLALYPVNLPGKNCRFDIFDLCSYRSCPYAFQQPTEPITIFAYFSNSVEEIIE
jgi:hypothetical protein